MEPESLLPLSQEPATEHINTIILISVPCIFYYFVLWPINAQLFK
jgi:hypothetical protein